MFCEDIGCVCVNMKSRLLVKFAGSEGADGTVSPAPSVLDVQRCALVRDP